MPAGPFQATLLRAARRQSPPGMGPGAAAPERGGQIRRLGHTLARRLQKHKAGCLRFLTAPQPPCSHNEAEHDLQMGKLRQNISGGFRSMPSACDFATLRSGIATTRKQDGNVLETLAHPDPIRLIPKLRFCNPYSAPPHRNLQSLTCERSAKSHLGSYVEDKEKSGHFFMAPGIMPFPVAGRFSTGRSSEEFRKTSHS